MSSAQQRIQSYIDSGRIDYNMLNPQSKTMFSAPSTDEERRKKAEAQAQAQVQQTESANLQNNANFKQFEASQPGPTDTSFSHFVAQENPTFVAEHPTLSKVLAAPGYALQSLADLLPQPVQNWANRAGQTGGEVMTLVDNPNKATTGNKIGDTTADLFGGLMGFVGNPTPGGVESAGAKLWQGGEQAIGKVLPRVLPNAPKLAQDALKIAGATIPYELTNAYVNNRPINPTEMGTAVGANVLLSALTHGIGKLGKGATRIEPAVDGVTQSQYRDVAPISTADQGLNEVSNVVNPISVNRVDTTLPDYQVGISDNVPLGRGAVPNKSVAADMGTPSAQMTVGLGRGANPTASLIPQRPIRVPGAALPEPQSKIIIGKPKEPFSFKNAWDKFYTGVVNTQQPIVNTAKATSSDMGKLASNTKNVSGIIDHNFLTAMVDKNGNKVGESLQKTVEAIPKGKEKDFWTYMTQRHNIDRAREGKPVQANYTPETSTEAVKIAEQAHPNYKAIGDNIVKWIDDFYTTWGVDTGIVDKDIYKSLRETYKSYFPTQRDFSELEKSIPNGLASKFVDQRTPIRKATGSERDIIDPIENIMNMVSKVVRTAKYNEVGQSLLNAVKEAPEKMKQFAEVIPTNDGMFANTDNVISVLVGGKAQYLKINNKMLLDSMNGLPKSIGELPFKMGKPIQLFKDLITQKNPFFALRNIFRDIPTAYVYGSESNPLRFGAGLIGAGKDILTNSPRLQKYQAVGGGGANFFSSGDVTKAAGKLTNIGKRDALINQIPKNNILGKGATRIANVVLHPLDTIEKFNNLTESAPRLSEFNRVLDKTGSVTEALYAANDVTVNFSRGGNITKSADKVVPYLNAGVQGLDKFFREFKDPKIALATIVKSGVAITAPDLALYMVNKNNPNYQALDNRTKDTYFLIPKSDGTFWKVPKSRELGVLFGSLFERVLRQSEGQPNSFKGLGNAVATNFAPANPISSNIISPYFNLKSNKDFANRAIVPQGMLMDKRSPYLQYDDKTTSIAKKIGELTTGIPILNKGGGLSPKQIDYLVKSYTGVIGQFGTPLLVPGGDPMKALTTQFTADPKFSSQDTTDFYDKLDKLSAAATDKNILEKIPSKTLTPEENMRNSMNGISTALSRGTKSISTIQSNTAYSQPQKDQMISDIKVQMLTLQDQSINANDPRSMQRVEDASKKLFLIRK